MAVEWLGTVLKSISDIGAANVLREKIDLLDLQREQAEARTKTLSIEVAQLRQRVTELESENTELRANISALNGKGVFTLDGVSEKMLHRLANASRDMSREELVSFFSPQSKAAGDHHFDALIERKLVIQTYGTMNGPMNWAVTPRGRKYLAERKLF